MIRLVLRRVVAHVRSDEDAARRLEIAIVAAIVAVIVGACVRVGALSDLPEVQP